MTSGVRVRAVGEGSTATPGVLGCSARFDSFGSAPGGRHTAENPGKSPQADGVCSAGSSPNNEWYQGARRDAAMGTYQFGSRTYNPATASFTTPDSYRAEQPASDLSVGTDPLTANTYTYVNGDPVNASDPTGHRAEFDDNSSYTAPTATTNYVQASAESHRENREFGENSTPADFGNAQTKATYKLVGETQTFNLQYDEHQDAVREAAAAARASASAAAAKAQAAKKHCGWAGCFLGSIGHAGLAFTDGAINGVTKTATGGLYDPNLSNCTAADTTCKAFLKAGSVTGQVGALVVVTVATGGAGDAAEGGALLAEAGEASEGVDGAEGALDAGEGAEKVNEGIYVIKSKLGTYVGQSGNIDARFSQHLIENGGRFTQNELDAADRFAVSGGKTAREIAEQLKIDEFGGIGNLLNKVNPIGQARLDLLPQPYTRIS